MKNKKCKYSSDSGITIVVLIITVVILLILLTMSINKGIDKDTINETEIAANESNSKIEEGQNTINHLISDQMNLDI